MLQCHLCGRAVPPDRVERRDVYVGSSSGSYGTKPVGFTHTRDVPLCPRCARRHDQELEQRIRVLEVLAVIFLVTLAGAGALSLGFLLLAPRLGIHF